MILYRCAKIKLEDVQVVRPCRILAIFIPRSSLRLGLFEDIEVRVVLQQLLCNVEWLSLRIGIDYEPKKFLLLSVHCPFICLSVCQSVPVSLSSLNQQQPRECKTK